MGPHFSFKGYYSSNTIERTKVDCKVTKHVITFMFGLYYLLILEDYLSAGPSSVARGAVAGRICAAYLKTTLQTASL